jgi:hypothetical protein
VRPNLATRRARPSPGPTYTRRVVNRSGRFILVAWALVLLAALFATVAGATEPSVFESGTPRSSGERLASESLLRLTDMPAGFVFGGEEFCGEPRDDFEDEGIYEVQEHLPPTPEEAFIKKTGSVICIAEYLRLYRAPGTGATPSLLISFALTTPSPAAATEGLAVGPELVEDTLFTSDFNPGVAPMVGEEARQFGSTRVREGHQANQPGVLVLWRQGREIGGVFAVSRSAGVSTAAAHAYAARQQGYLLSPRPFLAAEAEDMLTFLDNPEVKVAIYWLGPDFGLKGRSESFFENAYPGAALGPLLPGRELSVEYTGGPTLDTWTRSGWARFAKTVVGRRQWSWHCTRSRSVKLSHGHAVLYAAYRKDEKTCPDHPPKHFSAHVFLPGVVIAIGEPFNRWSQGYGAGAYESWRGLEAIVRRLHRWRPGRDS